MAVTIEVKEGQTATVDGPARMRVVGGAADAVSIGGTVVPFPGVEIKDGEVAEVTGPAIMRIVSDVAGSVLIDGEPVVKPIEPAAPLPDPVVTDLSPNQAPAGDPADIVMSVMGENFTPESVIVFNGYDEPTTFVSSSQISTGVKPSLFVVPADCPVKVRNGAVESNEIVFSFTESGVTRKGI